LLVIEIIAFQKRCYATGSRSDTTTGALRKSIGEVSPIRTVDYRYVSVVPDTLSQERRSRLMSRVKTRDTKPEIMLRRALWVGGLRGWRLHVGTIPGRPDLAWPGRRVAVFVDGAFWHGHPDYYQGQSGKFWDEKIARNRARDERVNSELEERSWYVVRLWDFEVEREIDSCVERVRVAWESSRTGSA
jgi:DNA mismatch endonuclease, patch repair protein